MYVYMYLSCQGQTIVDLHCLGSLGKVHFINYIPVWNALYEKWKQCYSKQEIDRVYRVIKPVVFRYNVCGIARNCESFMI